LYHEPPHTPTTLLPYTTLFRSDGQSSLDHAGIVGAGAGGAHRRPARQGADVGRLNAGVDAAAPEDDESRTAVRRAEVSPPAQVSRADIRWVTLPACRAL